MNFLQKNLHHLNQISPSVAKKVKSCSMKGFTIFKENGRKNLKINGEKVYNGKPEDCYKKQVLTPYKMLIIPSLGLGYQLKYLAMLQEKKVKTNTDCIIVVEKDPRVIKNLLCNIDLSEQIGSRKLYFICSDINTFYTDIYNLIFSDPKIKYFLKSYKFFVCNDAMNIDAEYYAKIMTMFVEAGQQSLENFGNSTQDAYEGLENMLQNIHYTFKHPGIINLKDKFKKTPGVVVAAGPSLKKNMKLLKELRNKAIIICVDTVYKTLLENNIYPHIVTGIERTPTVINYFQDLEDKKDETEKTIFAPATVYRKNVYKCCTDKYGMKTAIVYRDFSHYKWIGKDKGTISSGKSGANLAFKILKYLGCKTIMLVGQDLAFSPEGKTHVEGKGADWSSKGMQTSGKIKQKMIVKGNEVEKIQTTRVWYGFLKMYEKDIAEYKGRVINCTEGGAYISGAKYMPLRKAIDKVCTYETDIFKKLCNFLYTSPVDYEKDYDSFKKIALDTKQFLNNTADQCIKCQALCENTSNIAEVEKIKRDITLNPLFYLFLMHIIQSYVITFEIDFNKKMCELFGNSNEQKEAAVKMYKKWFRVIEKICLKSHKYIDMSL